jgi:hypothetical protein
MKIKHLSTLIGVVLGIACSASFAAPAACKQGFVWREAVPYGVKLCLTTMFVSLLKNVTLRMFKTATPKPTATPRVVLTATTHVNRALYGVKRPKTTTFA